MIAYMNLITERVYCLSVACDFSEEIFSADPPDPLALSPLTVLLGARA